MSLNDPLRIAAGDEARPQDQRALAMLAWLAKYALMGQVPVLSNAERSAGWAAIVRIDHTLDEADVRIAAARHRPPTQTFTPEAQAPAHPEQDHG